MTKGVADVLEAAADVLMREGWTQGTQHDRYGYCATGAIRKATRWGTGSRAVDLFGAYLRHRDNSLRIYGLKTVDELSGSQRLGQPRASRKME